MKKQNIVIIERDCPSNRDDPFLLEKSKKKERRKTEV